jgi:pimeloyl-ACP methyl ester carboxylesterase
VQSAKRNGVTLYFEEAPGADAPVVLIHGWCCDHTYLAPQFGHFAKQGRRVVAPDLRGHGASDKPDERYTMQGFADDVAFVCDHLGLAKIVIIGHSMGGIIAFDLASRYPELVSALIMLDAAIVLPEAARAVVPGLIAELSGPGYQQAISDFITKTLLLPTDDTERKEWILSSMASAPQHVAVSAYRALGDYDAAKTARVTAPSLYIAANEPRARADMKRVRELLPGLAFGQTVGSGHFCQLEVPDQVNAMIDRFLAVGTRPAEPQIG